MHTAEEYFAALEEYLKQMPAQDRAETITYYREYAQEGGLLDAEQLRAHFGPPEALAARILEDDAGKRRQDMPKPPRSEEFSPVTVLFGILAAVVALGIIWFKVIPRKAAVETPFATEAALPEDAETAPSAEEAWPMEEGEDAGNLPLQYDGKVEPFTEISVDVVSAEIRVEIGDDYALRYTLCDQEVVEQAGVEGQTLYLVSHSKMNQNNEWQHGEVCITVPADAALGNLQFSTVSGGVTIPSLSCDSVKVDNVAGNSVLDCVAAKDVAVDSTSGSVQFGGKCERLEMDAISGNLTFTGKADAVWLDTTAGKLNFTGTANSVEVNSTSGMADIQGTVTEQVQVDMVSGNIVVTAADPTVTAEGRGIDYNGQRVADDSWSRQGSGCTLILETSSGTISIRNS